MRFCRTPAEIVHEAVVQDVERQEPLLSLVHLEFLSALPVLMGDLLVLESMDGECQWEANVRFHGDPMFYEHRDDKTYSKSVTVSVHDRKGTVGPKLLRKFKCIKVLPAPSPTDEAQNTAKGKIKIGINGYGSIARTIAMIALDSKDLELVAINDPLITKDQMSCMFRDLNLRGEGWKSDFKMDCNTLMFGGKEIALFRIQEDNRIPWNEAGAEYIVESYDIGYGEKEVCTGKFDRYSSNTNTFGNRLSPLAEILEKRFVILRVEGSNTAGRVPVLLEIETQGQHAAQALNKVLPQWKGKCIGLPFKVATVDAEPVDIVIELALCKDYNLILRNTTPSTRFSALLCWCVEMTSQIREVIRCKLKFK